MKKQRRTRVRKRSRHEIQATLSPQLEDDEQADMANSQSLTFSQEGSAAGNILQMQRLFGNQAVTRMLQRENEGENDPNSFMKRAELAFRKLHWAFYTQRELPGIPDDVAATFPQMVELRRFLLDINEVRDGGATKELEADIAAFDPTVNQPGNLFQLVQMSYRHALLDNNRGELEAILKANMVDKLFGRWKGMKAGVMDLALALQPERSDQENRMSAFNTFMNPTVWSTSDLYSPWACYHIVQRHIEGEWTSSKAYLAQESSDLFGGSSGIAQLYDAYLQHKQMTVDLQTILTMLEEGQTAEMPDDSKTAKKATTSYETAGAGAKALKGMSGYALDPYAKHDTAKSLLDVERELDVNSRVQNSRFGIEDRFEYSVAKDKGPMTKDGFDADKMDLKHELDTSHDAHKLYSAKVDYTEITSAKKNLEVAVGAVGSFYSWWGFIEKAQKGETFKTGSILDFSKSAHENISLLVGSTALPIVEYAAKRTGSAAIKASFDKLQMVNKGLTGVGTVLTAITSVKDITEGWQTNNYDKFSSGVIGGVGVGIEGISLATGMGMGGLSSVGLVATASLMAIAHTIAETQRFLNAIESAELRDRIKEMQYVSESVYDRILAFQIYYDALSQVEGDTILKSAVAQKTDTKAAINRLTEKLVESFGRYPQLISAFEFAAGTDMEGVKAEMSSLFDSDLDTFATFISEKDNPLVTFFDAMVSAVANAKFLRAKYNDANLEMWNEHPDHVALVQPIKIDIQPYGKQPLSNLPIKLYSNFVTRGKTTVDTFTGRKDHAEWYQGKYFEQYEGQPIRDASAQHLDLVAEIEMDGDTYRVRMGEMTADKYDNADFLEELEKTLRSQLYRSMEDQEDVDYGDIARGVYMELTETFERTHVKFKKG